MLKAIHKENGKIVSAFQIIKDLSWVGKEREKFIAPTYEIGNLLELKKKGIDEVEVCFVKEHYRNKGKEYVSPHFRIITEGAVENPENESEEHKLAKETIYQKVIENEIILINFNNQKISSFGDILDVSIEKKVGIKQADVLVDFKEHHPVLGRGIAFEVQISPQNEEMTYERSYERSAQGYSIVWIWGHELEETNYRFKVLPFMECLEKHKEQIEKEKKFFLGDLSQKADEKVYEIQNLVEDSLKKLQSKTDERIEEINHFLRSVSSKMQYLSDSLVLEKAKEQIEKANVTEKIKYFTENFAESFIKDRIKDSIERNLGNIINEKIKDNLPRIEVPETVFKKFSEKIEEEISKLNFEGFTKKNLISCFKCSKCDSLTPVVQTYWKDSKPYCFNCFGKKEAKGGEKKVYF